MERALATENLDRLIQRRTDRPARDRDADRHVYVTLLPADLLRDRGERVLDAFRGQRLEVAEVDRRLREDLHGPAAVLFLGHENARVIDQLVGEEERDQILRVLERLHPFLDVRHDPAQRLAIPLRVYERFEPPDQLMDGEAPEPDGVAAVEAVLVALAGRALARIELPNKTVAGD